MNDIFVSDKNSLVREVLAAYDLPETLMGAVRYGHGHINDTYCVVCQPQEGDCKRFLLQGLSLAAFPRQAELMENYVGVTSYLREQILQQRGDPERDYGSLSIVSSAERIVIENISVTDGSEITLCAQASLEIIGDGTFFAALSFSEGAELTVDGVAMGGSVDFSGSAAIDVKGGASFVSDVYFADSALLFHFPKIPADGFDGNTKVLRNGSGGDSSILL